VTNVPDVPQRVAWRENAHEVSESVGAALPALLVLLVAILARLL